MSLWRMNNNVLPPNQPNQKTGVKQKPRRGMSRFFNILSLLGLIVVIVLLVWAEQQRRDTEQQLRQASAELEEMRRSSQVTGEELSQRVLERVRAHMDITMDPEPTVATIVDVDALKASNEFYAPAKNGDHLIITQRRAILYDPDRDIILDVVPVIIDDTPPQEQQPEGNFEALTQPEDVNEEEALEETQ
jgi:hypothetical protein